LQLRIPNLRDGYKTVCESILAHGELAKPRGALTRELLDATLVIEDVRDLLPVGTGRKVNTSLAAMEALQVVGGYSDAAALRAISSSMVNFEDFGSFHGAYGPRIRPQMEAAVRRLKGDPESRRAYVAIWDPLRDLYVEGVRNYPCTTAIQFTCRNDRLIAQVQMRANDAWHGLAYDAFVFGQLQLTVANVLGVEPGEYRHHATSLHLYEPHWDLAAGLTDPTADAVSAPRGFSRHGTDDGSAGGGYELAAERARTLGRGEELPVPTESETWYKNKVEKYINQATGDN
jgi:thymidylate synthase